MFNIVLKVCSVLNSHDGEGLEGGLIKVGTGDRSDKVVQRNDFSCSTQYVSEAKPLSKFGEWFFSNKGDFNIQINDMKAILK